MHLDFYGLNRIFNVCSFPLICKLGSFRFDFHFLFIYYKSKKLRGRVSTGEAVDTLFSIPNKYSFVCTDRQIGWCTYGQTKGWTSGKDGRTDICPSDEACAVTCALQLFLECAAKRSKMPLSVQIDR